MTPREISKLQSGSYIIHCKNKQGFAKKTLIKP